MYSSEENFLPVTKYSSVELLSLLSSNKFMKLDYVIAKAQHRYSFTYKVFLDLVFIASNAENPLSG